MQETLTIARPYAVAAYQSAEQDNNVAAWSEMLATLAAIVADSNMRAVINNPNLGNDKLTAMVFDVAGEAIVGDKGRNFVSILVDAGRLSIAPEIQQLFDKKRAESAGETEVSVTSAYELSDAEKTSLSTLMAKRLGKKVEVTTTVDEALIAGVVIQYGDSVIDASARGRLQALSNEFAN